MLSYSLAKQGPGLFTSHDISKDCDLIRLDSDRLIHMELMGLILHVISDKLHQTKIFMSWGGSLVVN